MRDFGEREKETGGGAPEAVWWRALPPRPPRPLGRYPGVDVPAGEEGLVGGAPDEVDEVGDVECLDAEERGAEEVGRQETQRGAYRAVAQGA